MNTHDKIELPQGYAERPFDYSGDLYIEGQVRAIIEANRVLLAERDALREALEVMVEMIEMKGFGFHYAMDLARAALAQGRRACTCHPDDRPDGPCRERYAASECQALAQGQEEA